MSAAILSYLQQQSVPVPSLRIIGALQLTHAQVYTGLVALESAGLARIVMEYSGDDMRALWEAM